ncbi:MAG: PEP-CTERM sorting domain-containing protein [Chthoniobacteraceae bacterium]
MLFCRRLFFAATGAWLVFNPLRANAVLFFATGDPEFNTTAPSGLFAGSGWDLQGSFLGNFLGTPIAPRHFITARHLGGSIGTPFEFQGVNYVTDAFVDDAESDLRVWHVTSPFPDFAPLYTASNEVEKELVVFGRGGLRGAEVHVGGAIAGWNADASAAVTRWGTNTVARVGSSFGGTNNTLVANFSSNGLHPNEADLSVGDSGGAIFIQDPDDDVWKLAGINSAVSGPYYTDLLGGGGFDAALFNQNGLFVRGPAVLGNETFLPANGPGEFFATRVSARTEFIETALTVPEPGTGALLSAGAVWLGSMRCRRRLAVSRART